MGGVCEKLQNKGSKFMTMLILHFDSFIQLLPVYDQLLFKQRLE